MKKIINIVFLFTFLISSGSFFLGYKAYAQQGSVTLQPGFTNSGDALNKAITQTDLQGPNTAGGPGTANISDTAGSVTLPGFGGATDALNKAITPNFQSTGGTGDSGLVPCGWADDPSGAVAEECQFEHLIILAKNVMDFLLFTIAVPIAAISFAWAGWLYMSAAGNESRVSEAHQIFKYVVLGLCIALAAWLIVNAIVVGLGVGASYNPLSGGAFGG